MVEQRHVKYGSRYDLLTDVRPYLIAAMVYAASAAAAAATPSDSFYPPIRARSTSRRPPYRKPNVSRPTRVHVILYAYKRIDAHMFTPVVFRRTDKPSGSSQGRSQ